MNETPPAASNGAAPNGTADDALRLSEERYRALVEATSQAVWSWSPAGGTNDLERSRVWWEEVTGQALAEQTRTADGWLDVVHPDDRAATAATWAACLTTGAPYDISYRVRGRLGGWRHVRARGVPVRGADGSVREWIGTLDDVTAQRDAGAERDRLHAEADADRRRLEEVFRHAPSFMAVLRGPDHVFERVNDRYVELIGGRDVLGRPVCEALPEVEGQGYFELLDRVYRTGEPHVAAEARITLHNSSAPAEHVLQFVYQPMLDAGGAVTGVIVQGIDLTERREAEAGLARLTAESAWRQRLYETALSNTADFVYLFDTDARFTYVNKALLDLWGTDLSRAIGRDFFDLGYSAELADRLRRQVGEVVSTGRPVRDSVAYAGPRGEATYEHIFMPVFGEDGEVEAVAGSTRDVTDRQRIEAALRDSERRHRALVTASSDVVYRMSGDWAEMYPLDGRRLVASNAAPIVGWMEKNVPAFEHARVRAAIDDALARRGTFELEHQVIRADGTLGWTFSRAVPILDDAGNIVEWFGTASDVTRRKRAEEDLRDIRSRMEAALEAGAIGTWSWDVRADRFHGDASLARMFSVDPADVAGGTLERVFAKIHPDDQPRVQALIDAVLADGERFEASYRVARPDGSWRWVTARGQVERDDAGRPVRFPGVVIDVSDWKQVEEELARLTDESERRKRLYETILSNTPDLAYVFDLDHRFTYANEVLLRLWGRTWDEAIGRTCLELGYEPWHAAMHDREIEQVKATRRPIRGEVPFNGTFGRRIYDYIFVPVLGTDGEVEAVAGTTRDVTERKEAEEALREADRKKDDFLALLAHELRNPLAPIRNGLEVVRLTAGPDADPDALDIMDRQLEHMVRLIDDLLDISRITRNKMELRRQRVTLADVVRDAVEVAGPVLSESGHRLTLSLPHESIELDADPTRLAQVFSNLLNNSAKYSPPGSRITLAAERSGGEVAVSVRDEGIGIPAESLPKIFDMFSQVDRSIERNTGGLGIGLALVKGLTEMHGGTVTAESADGAGSTFTVRLPVATPAAPAAPPPPSERDAGPVRRRVLVVDDNRDGARSMAMMLRRLGNEVATAHDGLEAVAAAESFRPQVILMDIGMPRLNGLDATRRIREQPWGREPTIIALTGWGQEADRARSKDAGCDAHLVKPVDIAELNRMLAAVAP